MVTMFSVVPVPPFLISFFEAKISMLQFALLRSSFRLFRSFLKQSANIILQRCAFFQFLFVCKAWKLIVFRNITREGVIQITVNSSLHFLSRNIFHIFLLKTLQNKRFKRCRLFAFLFQRFKKPFAFFNLHGSFILKRAVAHVLDYKIAAGDFPRSGVSLSHDLLAEVFFGDVPREFLAVCAILAESLASRGLYLRKCHD
mmetsp:Transcript_19470/g.22666  ORF Transcript_19470/g.22666 Transcript_19470/m.22666 type:complete len:200 (+) Transcript_19470:47-646(+)